MPYRSAMGNVYDSGEFAAVLGQAGELAGLAGFAERRLAAERRGRWRGIGVSCFLEHAGRVGTEGAMLAIDNNRLVVRLGVQASGQGHQTVFGNLVAERLGIAPDLIVVEEGESDLPIRGRPAVGSRSTVAAGTALVAGVGQLVASARRLAADLWQTDVDGVAYREGLLGGRRYQPQDVAVRACRAAGREAVKADRLTTIVQEDAITSFPNGCHIAEIEVDPETGAVTVVGYVAVDDCGVVLEDALAEGQIVGGIAQGFGQALLERVVYDETSQMVSASLSDYAMPRASDMPAIVSAFHPVPCPTNPLGVKGVGEAGTTAAIAAIMNAIVDAIPGGHGATIDMPATAEQVWRACRLAERGGNGGNNRHGAAAG